MLRQLGVQRLVWLAVICERPVIFNRSTALLNQIRWTSRVLFHHFLANIARAVRWNYTGMKKGLRLGCTLPPSYLFCHVSLHNLFALFLKSFTKCGCTILPVCSFHQFTTLFKKPRLYPFIPDEHSMVCELDLVKNHTETSHISYLFHYFGDIYENLSLSALF